MRVLSQQKQPWVDPHIYGQDRYLYATYYTPYSQPCAMDQFLYFYHFLFHK